MAPGLEKIISAAKTDGRMPSDIAMECFTITKENVVNYAAMLTLQRGW